MVSFSKDERLVNIIKGICVVVLFLGVSILNLKTIPLELLHIDYSSLGNIFKQIYSVCFELILIMCIYMIFQKQYEAAFEDIKKNHYKYFSENFKFYIIGVLFMVGANSIIAAFGGGISSNESTIREMFNQFPFYIYISSVFLAPVLEESVFRLGFRNIFKNNIVFILASGLIFGSLHLAGSLDSPLVILHLLAYSGCGLAFAYIMTRTNNILVSMGFHFLHNGFLMTMQIIMMFL